jgi:hypothetical protein
MVSGSMTPERGLWMYQSSWQAGVLSQSLTVPGSAPYFNISYRFINATHPCGEYSEYLAVYDNVGLTMEVAEICTGNTSSQWRTLQVPLHFLAGQSITLSVDISTQDGATLIIDNAGFVSTSSRVVDYY